MEFIRTTVSRTLRDQYKSTIRERSTEIKNIEKSEYLQTIVKEVDLSCVLIIIINLKKYYGGIKIKANIQ